MNKKISSLILAFIGLVIAILIANAAPVAPPTVYTTPPAMVIGKLPREVPGTGKKPTAEIKGSATFTVTAANDNDTVTGIFVYALPDEARQRLAQFTGKPLTEIPASVTLKEIIAGFQKGTGCPIVHLEIPDLEMDVAGAAVKFNRVVLNVPETTEEMTKLFCTWARQINVKRQRRGVIAAMNRLIAGE
ncbi:MAG: hypothetical protein SF339_12410 [Blastocatellia bacterium]|nr:hypothetical protein [Blastocatellia bacterium]